MHTRAVIVDDELLARHRLSRLLHEDGRIDVVAECASGMEALAVLEEVVPDVVFLDVDMPEVDGFSLIAQSLTLQSSKTVFVTAHPEHALRAFDVNATDYLLKPLSPIRLRSTIDRLCASFEPNPSSPSRRYAKRITVPAGARMRVIDVEDIDCIVANANYLDIHIKGQLLTARNTLMSLEQQLDPERFVRIHRSRIVRIAAIKDIESLGSGDLVVRLSSGERLSTGKVYRDRLREALGIRRYR